MSILVATDFSPCSRTAVQLAAALAQRRSVPLLLVHAVEPPPIGFAEMPLGATAWERDRLMAANISMTRDADEVRHRGVAVESRILLGVAADVILEAARDRGVDFIVVGTHGRKGAAHVFLGSVAERVLRASTCPVLVTRETVPDLDRWGGRTPLRLTVGVDGSTASQAALALAGHFASSQPCDLCLVRVYWPPEEAIRYGVDDPWGGPRREAELLPLLERDLRRDAGSLTEKVTTQLRFRPASREASEVFTEDASLIGSDALVVGVPRHRSGRWAALVPGQVLRASTLPVICVPEKIAPAQRDLAPVRSILIATDLSDASRQLVISAYGLLRSSGGRVELCTVHVLGPNDGIAEMPLALPLSEVERAAIESRLRALIPPDAAAFGITTSISVIDGRSAAEAILSATARLDVDLVAVGSHGRSGFKRALLGSVAEDVARNSPRPVLIVRTSRETS